MSYSSLPDPPLFPVRNKPCGFCGRKAPSEKKGAILGQIPPTNFAVPGGTNKQLNKILTSVVSFKANSRSSVSSHRFVPVDDWWPV